MHKTWSCVCENLKASNQEVPVSHAIYPFGSKPQFAHIRLPSRSEMFINIRDIVPHHDVTSDSHDTRIILGVCLV